MFQVDALMCTDGGSSVWLYSQSAPSANISYSQRFPFSVMLFSPPVGVLLHAVKTKQNKQINKHDQFSTLLSQFNTEHSFVCWSPNLQTGDFVCLLAETVGLKYRNPVQKRNNKNGVRRSRTRKKNHRLSNLSRPDPTCKPDEVWRRCKLVAVVWTWTRINTHYLII